MRYKCLPIFLLIVLPIILAVRIPPNPCPNIFSYFKDTNGRIYGEAIVPYDNATKMDFSVNASFVGRFKKTELVLKMVTSLNQLNNYSPNVVYNIFFPFENIIPKITAITYNGRLYCSGPPEPVVPGTPGITNVWYKIYFQFTRFQRPDSAYDSSDNDLPMKNPGEVQKPKVTVPPRMETISKNTPKPEITSTNTPKPEIFLDPSTIDLNSIFTPPTPSSVSATFTSPSIVTNNDFKCGISNNQPPKNEIVPLIWNSQDTIVGEYPWLVAFMVKNPKNQGYEYKCSGNLISGSHVITAARCVQYYNVQIVKTNDILLIMGTNNIMNWQSNGAIQRKVRKVESHPSFKENPKSAHGDLAILTMENPVQFSKVLSPVCLWRGSTDLYPFTNKMGVIAGYGQDENANKNGLLHVMTLKKADMPIVSQTECLTSPVGFEDLTSDRTFCTKSGKVATGPCIGDSGAGFFIKLNGAYYLRGIASAISTNNGTCDLSNQYSVFCDAAKFIDWIKTAME